LATSANARLPSKPPVFSGAGVSSSGICAVAFAAALTTGAFAAGLSALLDLQLARATTVRMTQSSGTRLAETFFIQAFPAASAAICRFFLRTATAETAMPMKYSATIGAMKMSMVVASGVGVMIAATIAITRIA
jgi:hypothetical protein